MDWLGAGNNAPLIIVRAIHFAATAMTVGSLIFQTLVAKPALRSEEAASKRLEAQTLRIIWIGLAVVIASGMIWFLLEAISMSGLPFDEAMKSSVLATVLSETQFGQIAEIRLLLAIVLAASLTYSRLPAMNGIALTAALGLTGAIAWTGHAGSTPGETGALHVAADSFHLVAAAGWIGGLAPLVLVLRSVECNQALASATRAHHVVRRFSILGIFCVATLLVTGLVNAWILVGSFEALLITEYGRLLMLKLIAFVAMLSLAAFNRFWWTPRLALGHESQVKAIHQLTYNSAVEIALGLLIFVIVGMLGTLHPAIHLVGG
jgi:putative copper resistance protein D